MLPVLIGLVALGGLIWLVVTLMQSGPVITGFPSYAGTGIDRLNIRIEDQDMQKLETKRNEAVGAGVLVTDKKDWVKIKLEYDGNVAEAKMRLKGDWTDHLEGIKWSFRVRMKTENAWNRLQVFSLHSPDRRDYLSEWVYHKLLEKEDVLTTRYGFVELFINGISRGLYAYEEHFEKQLPEFSHRREGPIVKFSEDGLWNLRKRSRENKTNLNPGFNQMFPAEVGVFAENKTLSDSALAAQFQVARNLLYQFQFDLAPPAEVMDMEKFTKNLAMLDLTRSYHGAIWHNHRYYYNPVVSRLEPIGFDGAVNIKGGTIRYYLKSDIIGFNDSLWDVLFLKRAILDSATGFQYFAHLEQMTRPEYLNEFFKTHQEEIQSLEALMQMEYDEYTFDQKAYIENAAIIRKQLKEAFGEGLLPKQPSQFQDTKRRE